MKAIIFTLLFLGASMSFAADEAHLELGFAAQAPIINAMLESDEAQSNYVGEASFADVIERDLRLQTAGKPIEGTTVSLKCSSIGENLLKCQLLSTSSDGEHESAIAIDAKIRFPALSTSVYVYDVEVLLAG